MSINVTKNKETILSAWKDVLDDKTDTDWALFGYEGQTNDLCFISKGNGGIEELKDDLNSGKIMYAYLKVLDPKTSLPKCVLINWQGEGAPLVRKGTCANHVRDVSNLLKGAHVTINARTEEDVDCDIIIDKVSKSTGSAYSFKERIGDVDKQSGPVGTTYKRVIPSHEINSVERDMFWQKEEEEEKKRQAEEKRRKEEMMNQLELERRQQEMEKSAEKEFENENHNIDSKIESARKEAEALIAMRNIDARAIFEKNTSAGQMVNRKGSFNKELTPSVSQPQMAVPARVIASEELSAPSIDSSNTRENATAEESQQLQQATNKDLDMSSKSTIESVDRVPQDEPSVLQATAQDSDTGKNVIILDEYGDMGLKAEALYDYQAADETEISFDPGDIITHIDQIDEGWWQGLGPDGTFGLFPANYVQLIY